MDIGLSHITFIVEDLDRTAAFLTKVFGAKEIYSSGDQTFSIAQEKFFLINDLWICIMEGDPVPERSYTHIAFQIQEDEMDDYISRLKEAGAEIKQGRSRVKGEGRSIYFYDFDNHLFELNTGNLTERLNSYSRKSISD